jgi:hypothetical protein
MYSGALKAGWGKSDGIDMKGTILVQDTLQILSGLEAASVPRAGYGDFCKSDLDSI